MNKLFFKNLLIIKLCILYQVHIYLSEGKRNENMFLNIDIYTGKKQKIREKMGKEKNDRKENVKQRREREIKEEKEGK